MMGDGEGGCANGYTICICLWQLCGLSLCKPQKAPLRGAIVCAKAEILLTILQKFKHGIVTDLKGNRQKQLCLYDLEAQ